MKAVWRKACACAGPSTTGRITLTHRWDDEKLALFARFASHPGPVCDVCDTPWSVEEVPDIPEAIVQACIP